ncbi:MAG: hypothetical protein ACKV1O_24515 [Saprospiraceae bacterium]
MTGYIFLVLTFLFYVCLIFLKPTAGHNDIISGLLLFVFYGIGFISSLMLTIKVVQHGGFDWVSAQSGIRNIIVGIGWIGMTMATLICLDIEAAAQPSELQHFFQWLAKSKSLIWMPLLMLVPYFILLNSNLKASISPNVYKIPLTIGFAISALMVLWLLFLGIKKKDPFDESKLTYERAIEIIDNSLSADPNIWHFAARKMDERVRNHALKKIRENKNLEKDMISELNGNNRYYGVYAYLDGNKVEHPEQFIEPIKNNIAEFAFEIGSTIQPPEFGQNNRDEDFFRNSIDVERLCRVLEEHFKDSSTVFRPNMIEVQKALEKEPLNRYVEIRNKYRIAVKNWLEANK